MEFRFYNNWQAMIFGVSWGEEDFARLWAFRIFIGPVLLIFAFDLN